MWLDSCNIKFSRAGWKFLNMQGSSDEEEEDPDDAESDFDFYKRDDDVIKEEGTIDRSSWPRF